jgi:hypothetical protein
VRVCLRTSGGAEGFPRPTRRVSLGRPDHDRREQPFATRTGPARPAPAEMSTKRTPNASERLRRTRAKRT